MRSVHIWLPAGLGVIVFLSMVSVGSAQESPDDLTPLELKCEKNAGKSYAQFYGEAADCIAECHRAAQTDFLRLCGAFGFDPKTADCIERARAKPEIRILKKCSGEPCPECYFGGDCRIARDILLNNTEFFAATALEPVFCDDSFTPDGLNSDEAACQDRMVRAAQRFTNTARGCFESCHERRQDGELPDEACSSANLDTPNIDAKTQSCMDRARRNFLRSCPKCFDEPECWGFSFFSQFSCTVFLDLIEEQFRFTEDGLFCVDQPICGDGRVSDSEECDYSAVPTGCDPFARCLTSSCECEALTCSHGVCQIGPPLPPGCGPCEATICQIDSFCCNVAWDAACVDQTDVFCGGICEPYGSPTRAFLSSPTESLLD